MKVQWEIEYLPSLKLSPAKYWLITKGKMVTFQWRKPEDTTLTAMKMNINVIGSEMLSLSTPLGNALGRAHCFWCIPARKISLGSNREETSDISTLGDILQSSWTYSSKVEGHSKKTWRTQVCSDQGDQAPACNDVRSQTGPQLRKKGH